MQRNLRILLILLLVFADVALAQETGQTTEWSVTVAPAVTPCERPGITGAGWAAAFEVEKQTHVVNLYPNHPDDWGKTKGTGFSYSEDGGLTWKAGPDNSPFPGMVDLWQDRLRDGELVCLGIRSVPEREKSGPTATENPYLIAFSKDQSRTWSSAEAVIHCPAEIGVIARPLPRIFEDAGGALLMPAYAFSNTDKSALLLKSEDRGRNWRVFSTIVTDKTIRASGVPLTTPWLETSVARVADGSLLAVMRTGSSAQAALVSARSTDGGATWGPVEKVVAGLQKRIAAGKLPSLCLMPNGVLVLLTAHTKDHCRLYLSPDGTGRQWSEGHIVTSQSGGNTSMVPIGADKLLVFTPANGRIYTWQVCIKKSAFVETKSAVASPGKVTVGEGASMRVTWSASPDATNVDHYLITPVLTKLPAGNKDAAIYPYAPIATRDAAAQLELGRKLLLGATYRFEVAAVDRAGRASAAASSTEIVAGAKQPKE